MNGSAAAERDECRPAGRSAARPTNRAENPIGSSGASGPQEQPFAWLGRQPAEVLAGARGALRRTITRLSERLTGTEELPDEVSAAAYSDLVEDGLEVVLHGVLGDVKGVGDHSGGRTPKHEAGHLCFA